MSTTPFYVGNEFACWLCIFDNSVGIIKKTFLETQIEHCKNTNNNRMV